MTDIQRDRPTAPAHSSGAFDDHNPPSRELISDCVHCGFCLTTCPTYSLWGEEMDSPRGRIQLMQAGLDGAPIEPIAEHIDACLGCMACVSSCPSGVQYDRLLEQTRAQVERNYTRTRGEKALRAAIFALFPYPKRLRAIRGPLRFAQRTGLDAGLRRSGVLRRLSPNLAMMQEIAPPLGPHVDLPSVIPAEGTKRATVGLLTGCVQREFFGDVNAATARVLAAEGCEVIVPAEQGCCGALSSHSGREEEAQAFARSTIETFEQAGVDYIAINSAGCGSAMKEYEFLLADDPAFAAEVGDTGRSRAEAFRAKVRDISELLVELGPVAERHPLPITIAYHDACHLAHAQGIRSQPRELLGGIPGLTIKEIPDGAICCGSAGVYNLLNPEPARELGDTKARNVLSTGAELLVTANPGCLMQISSAVTRQGGHLPTAHTVTVLDASLRAADPAALI
ncbi:(Fe-S)-binding protein [Leekyejoonella antrihumi]|uniref:Glycolate oxidase iron-sulfur subunit n=1 Tax=Leekyejoonella antrihumi TaxID=1660198 RepID=A0A563DTV9_9MICO|nr:heterodisulfide reductase-related iron-sulfur binding cluster [Leekyejoonella antrihumi]TWP33629.1 4Fe-4S dicluster domain-containing protein [Leekyejoonella antrihumi]